MSLFNPTRDQVRQFFFDTWQKFKGRQVLTDLEKMGLEILHMHPEYHPVMDQPEHYLEQTYFPEMGETNPFLHMSLHLSILEQLSIDQPPGIRAAYQTLLIRHEVPHEAQHILMDCLAETLWHSQRTGQPPDSAAYIRLITQQAHQQTDG